MLKHTHIFLLIFLCSTLHYCSPDKYIIKKGNPYQNRNSDSKTEYISGDESFSWTNNDDYDYLISDREAGYNVHNRYKDINGNNHYRKNKKGKRYSYNNKNKANRPIVYKIKKGDNLSRISKKFNIPIKDICKSNRIKNRNNIKAGMLIKIPVRSNRIVKRNVTPKKKPRFNWPIKDIINIKSDAQDGVKPIGIVITARNGSKILSSASGTVEKIGRMRGFGRYVILKHLNRYFTIYSNLQKIFVFEGDRIKSGMAIGKLEGNKLHFQIDYSGKPENPLRYLSKRG